MCISIWELLKCKIDKGALPFTHTGAQFTFFSLSAAAPERIASSMASLAKAGFKEVLLLGFSSKRTGGGGGVFMDGCGMSRGVGGGLKTGWEVTEGVEGQERVPAPPPSSEAVLNLSSSSAASDLVWRTQRHLGHINTCSHECFWAQWPVRNAHSILHTFLCLIPFHHTKLEFM